MTRIELLQWYTLNEQLTNGWHMSDQDKRELLQLNHRVMEIANNIHNKNMAGEI